MNGLIELTEDQIAALGVTAKLAKQGTYSPYSTFPVGAAIIALNTANDAYNPGDPFVFAGANVENASYGLTNCAERTAAFTAVASGFRKFLAVAINTDSEAEPTGPCGACRQVLYEFGGPDLKVFEFKNDGTYKMFTLGELLPHAFGPADLGIIP